MNQLTTEAMTQESTATLPAPAAAPPRPTRLPQWKVLLHNDRVNYMAYVVAAVVEIVRVQRPDAERAMLEAHHKGVSVLTVTHREHAELLVEQLRSKRLVATAEPDA